MGDRLQKLRWRSRRGMLELDTLFQEYFNYYGNQLDASEIDAIGELLLIQDQELFDAFSGKRDLEDIRLDHLFKKIIGRVNKNKPE